jgi:hypothetical protein
MYFVSFVNSENKSVDIQSIIVTATGGKNVDIQSIRVTATGGKCGHSVIATGGEMWTFSP